MSSFHAFVDKTDMQRAQTGIQIGLRTPKDQISHKAFAMALWPVLLLASSAGAFVPLPFGAGPFGAAPGAPGPLGYPASPALPGLGGPVGPFFFRAPRHARPPHGYDPCPNKCEGEEHCEFAQLCKFGGCGSECVRHSYEGPISYAIFAETLQAAKAAKKEKKNFRMTSSMVSKRELAIHPPDKVTQGMAAHANFLIRVSRKLAITDSLHPHHGPSQTAARMRDGGLSPSEAVKMVNSHLPQDCGRPYLDCNPLAKYRTLDGRCNNLHSPHYGAAHSPFLRYLHADYDDGVDSPRTKSVTGRPLPSPRLVSRVCHDTMEVKDRFGSHMMMQWGQFLDHDVTLTAESVEEGEGMDGMKEVLDCHACDSHKMSACCFPIPVPEDDPLHEKSACMDFKRSSPGQLKLGKREQINQITAFIDAGNVYGSDIGAAADLREGKGGFLKAEPSGLMYLKAEESCRAADEELCFKGGDVRVNEQAALVSIHTLWVHQHNKIASLLGRLNPHWGDGKLYQTARKIVGAQHQHITYTGFLPKVLGKNLMKRWGLEWRPGQRYNGHCDASVTNEFATAAFRFGHTLISKDFDMADGEKYDLFHGFFKLDFLHQGTMKTMMDILEGSLHQQCNAFDTSVNVNMKEHLFEFAHNEDAPLDVVSLNLQRGRDHGIPGYAHFRKRFGLPPVAYWEDLVRLGVMKPKSVAKLRTVYDSVLDMDLFTGLMAEVPRHGAMVGPTTAAIVGDVFRRLKYCDRFWYEWGREEVGPAAFSPHQIHVLRQTSLSKVLCDHVQKPSYIPLNAFEVPKEWDRRRLRCLPGQPGLVSVDLHPWREHPPHPFGHPGPVLPRSAFWDEAVTAQVPLDEANSSLRRRRRSLGQHFGGFGPPHLLRKPIPPRCFPKVHPSEVFHLHWV